MDPARLGMSVGEAMFTQRSIRRFRPDPIPVEDLKLVIEAAVRAPNGGNRQIGRFLVITDRDRLVRFGALYREAWWAKRRDEFGWTGPQDIPPEHANYRAAAGLADHMRDVPCVVLAFAEPPGGRTRSCPHARTSCWRRAPSGSGRSRPRSIPRSWSASTRCSRSPRRSPFTSASRLATRNPVRGSGEAAAVRRARRRTSIAGEARSRGRRTWSLGAPPVSRWFSKGLGDPLLAGESLDHIGALVRSAQARTGGPRDLAVFVRHEAEGRLHCEVRACFAGRGRRGARGGGRALRPAGARRAHAPGGPARGVARALSGPRRLTSSEASWLDEAGGEWYRGRAPSGDPRFRRPA